ncbi:MAG: putative metal-dependent hydrolase YcfH [Alphaproteobacteria bacterium MarineAlpha3_Bin5]|nr:MAG: putative metal-dependent hydrolase YcfH [Alphaproteobacteria bacterium MarineAlpha3_Bin5]
MLVDSHCHLDMPDFSDDIDDVVVRARDQDISTMLTICTRVAGFDRVHTIAERYENIFCTVGTHPHEAKNEQNLSSEKLIEFSRFDKVIGFGETGLDYYYENSPKEIQKKQFEIHIEAARETKLPVVIHSRNADDDTALILETEYRKGPFTGLIHCFTGGQELAKKVLEMGFYISISGIVTYKNAGALRDIVKNDVPLNRLLVETDSPYLAPVPKRGKRNEPAFTAYTASYLSDILAVSKEKLFCTTTENFFRLFTKARKIY